MTSDVEQRDVGMWSETAGGPDLRYGDLVLWGRPDSNRLLHLQVLDGPIMSIDIDNLRALLDRFEREWPIMSAGATGDGPRSRRAPDPVKLQSTTPTPVPSLRSRPMKRFIYEALWAWVHQGTVYRTFTIAEALAAVLESPKVQDQFAPFFGTEAELMVREAIQAAIKAKLDQAIWNAHGVRAFYAVPQPDNTWRWVHLRGLTKAMVEHLIADVDSNVRTLREKRKVYDTFLTALSKREGAILDDVYVEVRDALGWEE